jgi:hypothetical protein
MGQRDDVVIRCKRVLVHDSKAQQPLRSSKTSVVVPFMVCVLLCLRAVREGIVGVASGSSTCLYRALVRLAGSAGHNRSVSVITGNNRVRYVVRVNADHKLGTELVGSGGKTSFLWADRMVILLVRGERLVLRDFFILMLRECSRIRPSLLDSWTLSDRMRAGCYCMMMVDAAPQP